MGWRREHEQSGDERPDHAVAAFGRVERAHDTHERRLPLLIDILRAGTSSRGGIRRSAASRVWSVSRYRSSAQTAVSGAHGEPSTVTDSRATVLFAFLRHNSPQLAAIPCASREVGNLLTS
jgi:hypothetical protein